MDFDDTHDEEIPWISFSDATIALLFIFIATTFWFMIQLKIAEQNKQAEIQHLRGAQKAGQGFLKNMSVCLESRETEVHFTTKLNVGESSISLFIEPKMLQVVEWFEQGSSSVSLEASQVLSHLRSCISRDILRVSSTYTVVLTLEGHTDAQGISRSLQARFPSNWELSGARASAALRRLLCLDESCNHSESVFAKVLHDLMLNRDDLQIIAAGRADTQPAWQAICDQELNVGSITPDLDDKVCTILNESNVLVERNAAVLKVIQEGLGLSITEFDIALRTWANTPLCMYGSQRLNLECQDRLRKMRRVDLRISVRPKLVEIEE
jgi:flagellar motor protein MotB